MWKSIASVSMTAFFFGVLSASADGNRKLVSEVARIAQQTCIDYANYTLVSLEYAEAVNFEGLRQMTAGFSLACRLENPDKEYCSENTFGTSDDYKKARQSFMDAQKQATIFQQKNCLAVNRLIIDMANSFKAGRTDN